MSRKTIFSRSGTVHMNISIPLHVEACIRSCCCCRDGKLKDEEQDTDGPVAPTLPSRHPNHCRATQSTCACTAVVTKSGWPDPTAPCINLKTTSVSPAASPCK